MTHRDRMARSPVRSQAARPAARRHTVPESGFWIIPTAGHRGPTFWLPLLAGTNRRRDLAAAVVRV